MAGFVLSFRAKIDHGCLVLRDLRSEDDVSDWDPDLSAWHMAGSSMIFGVLPAVDGFVECSVWDGEPADVQPVQLFSGGVLSTSGVMVVHDPNGRVWMQFRCRRGENRMSVLVDNAGFAEKVQIVLGD